MRFPALLLSALLACSCADQSNSSSACQLTAWTLTDAMSARSLNTTGGYEKLAQTFKLASSSATVSVASIQLTLSREGSFPLATYQVTAQIQADAAPGSETLPSGIPLASGAVDPATAIGGTSEQGVLFTLATPITLDANKNYWLVLSAGYPASNTNYIKWAGFNGQNNYPDGKGYYRLANTNTNFLNTNFGTEFDFAFILNSGC